MSESTISKNICKILDRTGNRSCPLIGGSTLVQVSRDGQPLFQNVFPKAYPYFQKFAKTLGESCGDWYSSFSHHQAMTSLPQLNVSKPQDSMFD